MEEGLGLLPAEEVGSKAQHEEGEDGENPYAQSYVDFTHPYKESSEGVDAVGEGIQQDEESQPCWTLIQRP